ncbi:MAG: MBL fold metallo-hydrolase [Patescibacteria group bacterium]|nr:MBL fold metallo-hydrolase [Patescibacteria group bacterium]
MDVGQGDSIFIEAPNGNSIIIDGGPSRAILSELGKLLPFYDRSIDMLIVTNPDKDHLAGFIDVLKNYKVGEVLEPGTHSDTVIYTELEKTIADKKVLKEIAHRGMKIILDEEYGIYLDILFPDRDVSQWTSNDGSIVAKLVYGNTSYLLMGDATKKTENIVMSNESPDALKSDVLKLGHHGSKTSSGYDFVKIVSPYYAVISAGFHNRYGHPNKETMNTLTKLHISSLITFKLGTIVTESDGSRVQIK